MIPEPTTGEIADIAIRLQALFAEIEDIGRTPAGGYRRFVATAEDVALRSWFQTQAARLKLRYEVDPAGNQWAWWGEREPGYVVVGSHLDSVPDGGAFDGPLGVLSALVAVEMMQEQKWQPAVPLAIVNFTEEEGGRFPLACRGSRILTGAADPATVADLRDSDGIRLGDVCTELAADPQRIAEIGRYVELHIEQGRNLAPMGERLAVANAIWPHGRWLIDLPGVADHAGTTRMEDRTDALVKAARIILAVQEAAIDAGAVATVGKISNEPGAINAISSRATLSLDARAATEGTLAAVLAPITAAVQAEGGEISQVSHTPETAFDPGLCAQLSEYLQAPLLATGAGHDAGILADAGVPATMLFVRNPTGTSHSPAESASWDDCGYGAYALMHTLMLLAGDQ